MISAAVRIDEGASISGEVGKTGLDALGVSESSLQDRRSPLFPARSCNPQETPKKRTVAAAPPDSSSTDAFERRSPSCLGICTPRILAALPAIRCDLQGAHDEPIPDDEDQGIPKA